VYNFCQGREFYKVGIQRLIQSWQLSVESGGGFVEKTASQLRYIYIYIYDSSIYISLLLKLLFLKKCGGITFAPPHVACVYGQVLDSVGNIIIVHKTGCIYAVSLQSGGLAAPPGHDSKAMDSTVRTVSFPTCLPTFLSCLFFLSSHLSRIRCQQGKQSS
jgi:hypothetical protein